MYSQSKKLIRIHIVQILLFKTTTQNLAGYDLTAIMFAGGDDTTRAGAGLKNAGLGQARA
jgi:hypothetical protein